MNLQKRQEFNIDNLEPTIAKAKEFIPENIEEIEELEEPEEILEVGQLEYETPKPSSWSKLAKITIVSLVVLIITNFSLTIYDAWFTNKLLFTVYSITIFLVVLFILRTIFKELRYLKKINKIKQNQIDGTRLKSSMQIGEAQSFIENVSKTMPISSETLDSFKKLCNDNQNDAEILLLFEKNVIMKQDKMAENVVTKFAVEASIILAASPIAMLDVALMLWRNQKMIDAIAKIYGVELGYFSRLKLIKNIIINLVYAGATELIIDLGTQFISMDMSGKISTRLSQGIGGGLLTARLGYKTMAACRPITFTNPPRLRDVHKKLLSELNRLIFNKEK